MGVVGTRTVWLAFLALAVALGATGAAAVRRPVRLGPAGPVTLPAQTEMCLVRACLATPAYLTPRATGGAQDITLIYEQPGSQYASPAVDLPLVAHLSPGGHVLGPFLNSFLLLRAPAPSGGTYANPHGKRRGSDMPDWTAFLHVTFRVGLPALEQAFAAARRGFHGPVPPLNIFLMVPYPAETVSAFGAVGGRMLDLAVEADREAALRWYVDTAIADWRAAAPPHMRLAGFYWMREDAAPYQAAEIHALAADIHPAGLRLLWIPYKGAEYAGSWASYGFDAAVLQPNYYENGNRTVNGRPAGLSWTAAYARVHHMGIELEMNGAVASNPVRERRFYAYLQQGAPLGYEHGALVAIFQGRGAIARLARDPARYWLYNDLYRFTRGEPIPAR